MYELFAQVPTIPVMQEKSWVEYGILGAIAVSLVLSLLWFMRHVVTVMIPDLVTKFTTELKEERSICERRHEENKQVQLNFATAMKEVAKELNANTAETRTLSQENRALAGSVGNLANKMERT